MKNNSAVFFDLDKTISSVTTEKLFCQHLMKRRYVSLLEFFRVIYRAVKADPGTFKDPCITRTQIIRHFLKNKDAHYYRYLYNIFHKNRLKKTIYPQIYELIADHKQKRRKIYIVSGSVDFIVRRFAGDLGIDAYYSTKLEIKDNLFTGEISGQIHYAQVKAELIKKLSGTKNIDLSKSYAYGDDIVDRYMLELVGNPVVVNPDPDFKELAHARSWKIVNWK